MELRIETRTTKDGTDHVLRGDQAFFWWLVNAATGARNGFNEHAAAAEDPVGHRLVLEPLEPLEEAAQRRRSPTARPPGPPAPARQPIRLSKAEADGMPEETLQRLVEQGAEIVQPPAPAEPPR